MSALKKITHEEQGEVNVGVAHTPTFTDTPLAIDLFFSGFNSSLHARMANMLQVIIQVTRQPKEPDGITGLG